MTELSLNIISNVVVLVLYLNKSSGIEVKLEQESNVPVMIYEANSRGYFIKLKVENRKIYISKDRNASNFKIRSGFN